MSLAEAEVTPVRKILGYLALASRLQAESPKAPVPEGGLSQAQIDEAFRIK
jgi:hypothetical protein